MSEEGKEGEQRLFSGPARHANSVCPAAIAEHGTA